MNRDQVKARVKKVAGRIKEIAGFSPNVAAKGFLP
jgi:hypothetical protein